MGTDPRLFLLAWLALVLAGCDGPQSALDPGGPVASSLHRLGMILYAGAAAVTLLVTVLMLVPFVRPRERRANRRLFLWGGGIALPGLTLTALMPYVLVVGAELPASAAPDRLVIEVTGHVYWWEVSYRRADAPAPAISANELRLPVGEPVEIVLRASDVIHSFWVPGLAGKMDMIPGRINRIVIQADRAGLYRGQCAEYCGAQHARMAFDVIASPRGEFDAWLASLSRPARDPAGPQLREGREHFVALGCGACHAIRGLSDGRIGPDLTNVGARHSIGAGALPGGAGNIAGWIAGAQHIKPGNRMPSFDQLDGTQLGALAAYLDSLR